MSASPPSYQVRAMRPEDVPAVAALDRRCFTLPWSEDTFEAECRQAVGYYRVVVAYDAVDQERIVGFLGSVLFEDEAHITTFGVDPDCRRQGLGDLLLGDFLREAVLRRGARILSLEVRESNVAAIALYRKWGFLPISRRKRYYSDNDEDALVLWIENAARAAYRDLLAERLAALEQRLPTGVRSDP